MATHAQHSGPRGLHGPPRQSYPMQSVPDYASYSQAPPADSAGACTHERLRATSIGGLRAEIRTADCAGMRGLGEAAASAYGQQFYDNTGSDAQQAGLMMNDAFLNSQMNMVRCLRAETAWKRRRRAVDVQC